MKIIHDVIMHVSLTQILRKISLRSLMSYVFDAKYSL